MPCVMPIRFRWLLKKSGKRRRETGDRNRKSELSDTHRVVIGVGSNILPEVYIPLALESVRNAHTLLAESDRVVTRPIGFKDQPDFINGVLLIETEMERNELKAWLHRVEADLGRVRTSNINGPRTIDLDIVVWDGEIVDPDFDTRDFLRQAVYQVWPELK